MRQVTYKGDIYAIHDSLETLEKEQMTDATAIVPIYKQTTKWYGEDKDGIQASRMCYSEKKTFKTHKHIMRPRLSNYTQECFIVFRGKIHVEVYNDNKELLVELEGNPGDIILLYKGYHKLSVLENDSVFFEIKNGPFTNIHEDKEYMYEE